MNEKLQEYLVTISEAPYNRQHREFRKENWEQHFREFYEHELKCVRIEADLSGRQRDHPAGLLGAHQAELKYLLTHGPELALLKHKEADSRKRSRLIKAITKANLSIKETHTLEPIEYAIYALIRYSGLDVRHPVLKLLLNEITDMKRGIKTGVLSIDRPANAALLSSEKADFVGVLAGLIEVATWVSKSDAATYRGETDPSQSVIRFARSHAESIAYRWSDETVKSSHRDYVCRRLAQLDSEPQNMPRGSKGRRDRWRQVIDDGQLYVQNDKHGRQQLQVILVISDALDALDRQVDLKEWCTQEASLRFA